MSARSTAGSLTIWLGLAAIVVLADQVTKTLILGAFADGEARPVTSFFNLADSAITLGAACLILDELLRVRRAR